MTQENVLVPYNFTNYDRKALEFIIHTFPADADVDITLFVAHTPVPKVDVGVATVMDRLKGSLNYLEQLKRDKETALKKAAIILIEAGFREERIHTLFAPKKKDVATEIVDLVEKNNFTLVVLNHKPGKVTHFFTGTVYNKVINALKNTTVCVVT